MEHVHLLGILWLPISAFNTIGAVVVFIAANTLFSHLHEMGTPPEVPNFLHVLLSVIAVFILARPPPHMVSQCTAHLWHT
jgi:hypothetical protein